MTELSDNTAAVVIVVIAIAGIVAYRIAGSRHGDQGHQAPPSDAELDSRDAERHRHVAEIRNEMAEVREQLADVQRILDKHAPTRESR